MRRFGFLVVAAVLASASSVSAQPARASAGQPAEARRKAQPARAVAAKSQAKPAGKSDAKPRTSSDAKKQDAAAAAPKVDAKVAKAAAPVDAAVTSESEDAIVMSDTMQSDDIVVPVPSKVSTTELMTQYQRVGRSLMLLQRERQNQIGVELEAAKMSCNDLQQQFRLINVSEASRTAESRIATSVLLLQLSAKIDRLRGIAVSKDCLNNPLAKDCL